MQENSDFFAIFSLEDARVASYSLEARIFARPLAKAKQVAERDINNTNVREAIVRPKGDKNINQQLIARKTTHCAFRGIEG